MAGFKSIVETNIGTTKETIFTCSTGTTATLIGLSLSNLIEESVEVSCYIYKNSQDLEGSIITNAIITPGASLMIVGGNQKIVLEENDEIRIESNKDASIDSLLSFLESEG